jgi:GR25 family glycosyltransferase involved in LPS biosynthesis
MDEILVCHYRPNVKRKRYLESLGIPFRYITEYDRESLSPSDDWETLKPRVRAIYSLLAPMLIANIALSQRNQNKPFDYQVALNQAQHYLDNDGMMEAFLANAAQPLSPAERSLFLKHMHAMSLAASRDADYTVIVEDDCIFQNDSYQKINELLSDLNSTDFIDLAGGVNFSPIGVFPESQFKGRFVVRPQITRTLCGYAIAKTFAAKVINLFSDPLIPIDHLLTYSAIVSDAQMEWIHPPILVHGSEHGFYSSSIR